MLTVIATFWTQVDYRSRLMQPWAVLAKQPQVGEDSLLLDYISPNPVSTFVKYVRKRHWPVTAALLGSVLLKLFIVASTGLFMLQSSSPPRHAPFSMVEQLQLSGFNSSNVDDVAALRYAGALVSETSYPPGTNASFAVEMFNSFRVAQGAYSQLLVLNKLTNM